MVGEGVFIPTKKKMEDTGTRYQHLADLQDIWNDGLEVVKNSFRAYPNVKDQTRITQIEGALKMLNAYMEQLANYDGQRMAFNKILDDNAPTRAVIDAIKKERTEAAKAKAAKGNSGQSSEEGKAGGTNSDPGEPQEVA